MNIAATNATGMTATDIQAKRRDRLASGEAAGTGAATGLAGLDMLTSLLSLHGPPQLRATTGTYVPATTRSDLQPPRTHRRTCKRWVRDLLLAACVFAQRRELALLQDVIQIREFLPSRARLVAFSAPLGV